MSDFFLDWIDGGAGSDPYLSFVRILCHFNTSSGSGVSRTYVNEITGSGAITTIGSATTYPDVTTGNFKFGPASLLYPAPSENGGVQSSEVPSVYDYNVDTGDFTEEFFVYLPNTSSTLELLDARASGGTAGYRIYCYATGVLEFWGNGAARITSAGNALSSGVWQHIAVSRASGVTRLFVDGTQVGSSYTDSNNYTATTNRTLGNFYNAFQAAYNTGFDEWRLTVGVGRYTSNFTPPSSAFPNF